MLNPCATCGAARRIGHVNTEHGARWFCYCPACADAGRLTDRELLYLHEMLAGWLFLRRHFGKGDHDAHVGVM
jgi:hypothetical protein